VLLVNLLAALNFANVFLNKKRLENKKRDQNLKKNVKNVFYIYGLRDIHPVVLRRCHYGSSIHNAFCALTFRTNHFFCF